MSNLNLSETLERFKKRQSLIKAGKIKPEFYYDETPFEEIKDLWGSKKTAIEKIADSYPKRFIPIEEMSPEKTKKNTKTVHDMFLESTLERFKLRQQLIKEGKIKPRFKYDTMELPDIFETFKKRKGFIKDGKMDPEQALKLISEVYPDGIPLNINANASPELTKENRRAAYEKKMKNIANEAVRTVPMKNIKDLSNAEILEQYGKTRGEALIKKRGPYVPVKTESKENRRAAYEKKMKNIANEAVRTIPIKEYINKTNGNIIETYGKTRGEALVAKKDEELRKLKAGKMAKEADKKRKETEQEEEQRRLDEEQVRRRLERERQRVSENDTKYKEQKKVYKTAVKESKEVTTPMREVKAGATTFKFAKGITKCARVMTLDQKNAPTCWFNSLMMVLFFSQNTRVAVASSIQYIKDKRKFHVVEKIGKLLQGYNKTRVDRYMYERLHPKAFLETIRELHPEQFPGITKTGINTTYRGDSIEYLHRMLQFLEIPHLILSRPSIKSGSTEWSQYNYDMYDNKILGDAFHEKVGTRKNSSTYPKFVDTKHPIIISILTDYDNDRALSDKIGSSWVKYKTYPVNGLVSNGYAPEIKYNGYRYYLDSMILGNYNARACESGHAIAGVTCNGGRFMYNGWTRGTVDKGMAKSFKGTGSSEACPLESLDWAVTTNFCISKDCGFDRFVSKLDTKSLCFSTIKGTCVTYVREDLVGSRIPSVPHMLDKMKQKQTEEGIYNNERLKKMGILKKDPKTGKYVKASGY
ncbi:hypothetical protein PBCVCviKI_490L [Paramecium bursaria Chlorella virus CviKI]|nr:hypothetical protein PBCVCviKI_490L [Paramecium bursaria Chlorella virus CviKI]AGE55387.1 hypothetical protein PBCVMA1E_600L [Paramecium bursaria Chlorella virus MA1E]